MRSISYHITRHLISLYVTANMNPGYLAFYPVSNEAPLHIPDVILRLTELRLLGSTINDNQQQFHTGSDFLQLITFMGCSPTIPLEKSDPENDHCTIKFWGPYGSPRLLCGSNTRPPRCPLCRHTLLTWKVETGKPINSQIDCPGCRQPIETRTLNWRQLAGISQLFMTISQVYPGEAVPVDSLMRCLEVNGEKWEYCYIQDPILLKPITGDSVP